MSEWLQASDKGLIRFVDLKMGPGWWHAIVLSTGENGEPRLDTKCGFPLLPNDGVAVVEASGDDWVCDVCVGEAPPTKEEAYDAQEATC